MDLSLGKTRRLLGGFLDLNKVQGRSISINNITTHV